MFDNVSSINDYLLERNVSVFGLDAICNLLDILDHPEKDIKFVHVTGTNGKGSTSAYIINILKESGYKVGSFSSPQVFDDMEIIRLNNVNISHEDYVATFGKVYEAINIMQERGLRLPTKFEIETAMSFVYFKAKNCDIAVIEVGLGGDLDSTNVIKDTLIEVVTRISYDHMGILGKTLKEIATHKSGIIKNNSMVVTTMQDSEVVKVLKNKCDETHSQLVIAGDGTRLGVDIDTQIIAYKGREYPTHLLGYYQIYNLPIAIECARCLKRLGYDNISDNSIIRGVEETRLEGRFEVIGTDPIFIIDGAHNDEASNMLRESLKSYSEDRKIIFILGIFKDKDYKKILSNTVDLAREIITFNWDNDRRLDGDKLRDEVSQHLSNVKFVQTPKDAVETALCDADKGDIIVAFGSLSHLKDIRNAYKGVNNG